MFELKARGVCEMLDKIEKVDTPLQNFRQVVGVTSHDSVYFRTAINVDCPPSESPFAGTPAGKNNRKARSVLSKISASESNLISKISALSLSSDQAYHGASSLFPSKPSIAKTQSSESRVDKKTDLRSEIMIKKALENVDELSADGKIEESLLILLQLLEGEELKGDSKLLVHKKIASRAILFLEWHKE